MIDEYWTWIFYGYNSDELTPKSHKPIVARCDGCCKYRILKKQKYNDLCKACSKKGSHHTEETKRKMSISGKCKIFTKEHRDNISRAHIGKPLSQKHRDSISAAGKGMKRQPFTKEHRENMSKSRKGRIITEECRKRISEAGKGRKNTYESRRKGSATKQGLTYEEWKGFVIKDKYCSAFNEEVKEYIRNKYGCRCFVCDKSQKDNGQKLSVHHVDMNKQQGCDEHMWKLVPLCKSCHAKSHGNPLKSRIVFLIDHNV